VAFLFKIRPAQVPERVLTMSFVHLSLNLGAQGTFQNPSIDQHVSTIFDSYRCPLGRRHRGTHTYIYTHIYIYIHVHIYLTDSSYRCPLGRPHRGRPFWLSGPLFCVGLRKLSGGRHVFNIYLESWTLLPMSFRIYRYR